MIPHDPPDTTRQPEDAIREPDPAELQADSMSNAGSAPELAVTQAAGPAALRGSLLRGGAYALTVLMSLGSAPLLIRHLGIAEYGRYATVIALVTVVGGLTDAGMLQISVREWSTRSPQARAEIMRELLGLRLELSALAVAAGVGFAVVAGYDHVLVLGTLVAGIGMFLQVTADFLTAPLQAEMRFGWASVIDLSRQAVFVSAVVALVLAGFGVLPFLAASIPSSLVALLISGRLAHRHMSLVPILRGTHRWALLRDTLPYSAATAVNTFYFRVTILAMSLIGTATQTGYFATSFRVTEVLIAVPSLAIGTAFPIISRAAIDDRARFLAAVERMFELSLLAGAAVVLGVVLIAPLAISVLAGHAGGPATSVLRIQSLGFVATFPSVVAGFVLLSLRRHRVLLLANVAALCMNLVLTIVLVPGAQAHGAAIAAVISETLLAVVEVGMLLRSGDARLRIRSVLTVVVCGGAGALALLIPVGSIVRTISGLLIYVAMLVALGQFPPEARHMLPLWAKRRA
jgi:O-antigen/teichoic acid export membrane protein